MAAPAPAAPPAPAWGATHRRRLMAMWRSAGWPCHDPVELDLLAAGLLQRQWDAEGRETLRVTDAGLALLAASRRRHVAARDPHEALVARVARQMQHDGRFVWRGLALRAPLPGADGRTQWAMAMPDVYSIRHTTVEAYVEPVAHEVKVRRADLLSDLRRPAKAQAYAALASQCWYVLAAGIGEPEEVPEAYGVIIATPERLEVLRPAPRRPMTLGFSTWMGLVRARAEAPDGPDAEPEQAGLAPVDEPVDPPAGPAHPVHAEPADDTRILDRPTEPDAVPPCSNA